MLSSKLDSAAKSDKKLYLNKQLDKIAESFPNMTVIETCSLLLNNYAYLLALVVNAGDSRELVEVAETVKGYFKETC